MKKVKKVGFLRMAATPQDCQDIFRKDASLANPLTSDARSVMLRIPLPEDDGFALALPRRGQASFAWSSLTYRALVYLGREPVTYRFLPIRCHLRGRRKGDFECGLFSVDMMCSFC